MSPGMPQNQSLKQQLEAAQAQILQLTQQLATERGTARQIQAQLQGQLEQQQQHITQLEAETQRLQWIVNNSPTTTYRHLFDCNPQPMWVYDLETLRFLAVNDAAIAKYGYSRAQFLAMTIADIRPPEDVPRLLENVGHVSSGLDMAGIWQHRLRNGCIIQVEIVSHTLEFEGRQAELVMAQDVTQRLEAEQALHNLNQTLEQTVAERTAELLTSEAKLQAILNYAPTVIYVKDLEGRHTLVNQAYLDLFGCAEERVVGKTNHEIFPPDIADAIQANDQQLLQRGEIQQFEETVRLNSEERIFLSHKFLLRDEQGEVYALCGMSTDITDRKQAELALRESRRLLQSVLDAAPIAIFWKDQQLVYQGVSTVAAQNLGFTSASDCIGLTDTELPWSVEDAQRFQHEDQQIIASGQPLLNQTCHLWLQDETELWFEISKVPLRDSAGNIIGVLGTTQDITERKQAEIALQDLSDRLSLSLQAGGFGSWALDLVEGAGVWDERMYQLFGVPDLGQPLTHQDWRDRVHPDDIDWLEAKLAGMIRGEGGHNFEYRIYRPDGELRWLQGIGNVQHDAEGNPVRVFGLNHDITDRKRQEANVAFLADLADELARLSTANEIMQTVGAKVGGYLNTTDCVFVEVNEKLDQAIVNYTWHPVDWPEVTGVYRLSDFINEEFRQAARAGETIIIFNTQTDPRVDRDRYAALQVYAYVSVPCHREGVWRSMFTLHDAAPRNWREDEIALIREVANRAFSRLEAARAEADLRKSESALRLFITASSDIIYKMSADWREMQTLDGKCFLVSTARPSQSWFDAYIPPAEQPRVWAAIQTAIQTKSRFELEHQVIQQNGTIGWTFSRAIPLLNDQGEILEWFGTASDISDRKQAELRLQSLSDRLTVALQAGAYGIWEWHLADGQLLWDERLYEIYGKPNLGQALIYEDWRRLVHPDDIEHIEAQVEPALQGKAPFNVEFRIWRADGKLCWVQTIAQVQRDDQGNPIRMVGINQDITERKEAETRLRNLSDRLSLALTAGQLGVWSWDLDQRLFWDAALCRIYGISETRHLISWQDWCNLVHPDDIERINRLRQAAISGEPYIGVEFRIWRTDGELRWIQSSAQVQRDDQGNPVQMVGLNRDITDRKAAEAALLHTNAELERATRLKDEFLANMSHELRTPLNAILGMTEGLQDGIFGPISDRQRRSLSTIEHSGTHLLSLINDVLDVAKIEAGQLELDYAPVSVRLLCNSSLTLIKQQAHKKRLHLEPQIPSNLPTLYGDERRLRQILVNLLSNAVKFTPEDGRITVTASYAPLTLEEIASHSAISHPQVDPAATIGIMTLAVADTGIGISPDNMKKLFQPFIQIDSALNRQNEGTGLGLALVKRITELHGGQVVLTSEVGNGSCFTLQLPVISIPSDNSSSADFTATIEAVTPVDRATVPLILLAEDNEANISTTTAYLTAKGYDVIVAKNGTEVINLVTNVDPDLILMDIQMPQIDGLATIHEIRQKTSLANVPIVALTALAMPEDRERCLVAGANEYISKPIRLKQLVQVIQILLASR